MGSDTSSVTLKSTDVFSPPPAPEPVQRRPSPIATPTSNESNPWLAPRDPDAGPTASGSKAPRKQNEILVSKDSAALDKSKNKLKKKAKKRLEEKEKAKDEAIVEISMDNVLTLDATVRAPSSSSVTKLTAVAKPSQDDIKDDADANSEVDEQERLVDLKSKGKVKGVKAFAQRDLVALAFAGDNVVQVCSPFSIRLFMVSSRVFRTLKMQSVVKSQLMRLVKSIPLYLVGYVSVYFPTWL